MKAKTIKAISCIRNARGLIDMARCVLLAQKLLKDSSTAPDLMPIVEHLLINADVNRLAQAEKELKSIEFPQ